MFLWGSGGWKLAWVALRMVDDLGYLNTKGWLKLRSLGNVV